MTNTRVATRLHPAISINTLYSKGVLSCLDTWRTSSFNCPTVQEHHFLTLRGKNHKPLQPSYFKGGSWLPYIGQLVTLYARAARAILNHTPIDSTFSMQSVPNVHVAIARWKHADTSLQTVPGLLTVP